MIPPVFSSFYNNTYLKDVHAIYAKELPISSPDPITPPAILTLSPILPPSLLFNLRYFSIPEEHLRSESIPHLLPQLRYLIHPGIKPVIWYHHLPQFILLPHLRYLSKLRHGVAWTQRWMNWSVWMHPSGTTIWYRESWLRHVRIVMTCEDWVDIRIRQLTLQRAYGCILGTLFRSVQSEMLQLWYQSQMVGTRGSTPEFSGPAFDAAVQRAVDALLPGLTTRLTNEIRQNGAGGSGDQPPTIHTWLERFGKQKPRSFSSATTPVDAENWIAHIEKIFEVLGCADEFKARLASYKLEGDALNWWKAFKQAKGGETYVATLSWKDFRDIFFLQYFPRLAGFVGKKAGPPEEQAKHFKWALCDWILDGIVNTEFTDVAQVANAARNMEILRERSSQNNKRNRNGDRIRPTAQDSNQRGNDQKRYDGRGYDRKGNNQRGYDQKGYNGRSYDRQGGNSNQKSWQNRGQQYNRSSGSSGQKGYSDYASSPPCDICGKLYPGKACHRVTGACFICGLTGHMARDCPKNGGNGGRGNGNDNQPAAKGKYFLRPRIRQLTLQVPFWEFSS
ncbi:retrotransposon protein, putative, ty3-gypsy subclass [Tanacetum coccineum]